MHITQIEILKYKSIKQPVSLYFNKGKVIALIGKNGSGKTNVLEAIKFAMSKNHYPGIEKIDCEVRYHIELADDELKDYFSSVQAEKESKNIIVDFNGANLERRLVSSSAIWIEAKTFKTRIEKILTGFKSSAQKYIDALRKVETYDNYCGSYIDIELNSDNKGSFTYLMRNQIEYIKRSIDNQVDSISKFLEELFEDNKIFLNRYDYNYRLHDYYFENISLYKIAEKQIKISPIVASSLQISKNDLNKANERLNKKIKEINQTLDSQYNEMQSYLDEYNKIKDEIAKIFNDKSEELSEHNNNINKQFESIVHKIKNIVFCNCYYLDNENSLIFYNSMHREYQNERIAYEYLNARNPITEAFDTFLHSKGIIDESKSITQKDKLERHEIEKAVKLLNKHFLPSIIPKFDNNEVMKFEVSNDNESLRLFVHEKNGDIVSFNDTSLGRRWYLTYQFVKALLKPGDMLLIDEPAAFLHPQAKVELRKELETLAQSNIGVFYSTHSTYMIPSDWDQVYNVTMTDDGTKVKNFHTGDDLCETIKTELGVDTTADILFNLSKTILLVEGKADMICFEKFAELLKFNLNDYHIHVCDGEAILQVAYVCLKYKTIKVKVVLDNDNNFKNDYFKLTHSMYDECINVLKDNVDSCVYIGIGEKGCLEDLFDDKDKNKYKYDNKKKGQWKVNIDAVKNLKSLDDVSEQTIKNFEQLFRKIGIPKLDGVKA